MSSISSIPAYVVPPALSKACACHDDYTINSGLYGPVVANVIGAANAAADSVSAIVSFSAEGLEKLGDIAEAGYDAVGTALGDTGDAVGTTLGSVTSGITRLYTDVAAMANEGLEVIDHIGQTVSDAAEDVIDGIEDGLSDAAAAASDAASSVSDGISAVARNVVDLVSLGVTASLSS